MIRILALLLIVLVCCGASCNTTKKPKPPVMCEAGVDVDFQDRTQFVAIGKDKTKPVLDTTPAKAKTYGDAWKDRETLKVLLGVCNTQLREIEGIEGTETR